MSGRVLAGGLVLFALVFGAALWWFQTRGHYVEVTDVAGIDVAGAVIPVSGYRGIDAATSPLKLRACFAADVIEGPPAQAPDPLIAPDWFDCFDAEALAKDIEAGAARAILAERNQPYGFDRIVAAYADGRTFMWRQINECGAAAFAGDPLPEGCPPAPQGYD